MKAIDTNVLVRLLVKDNKSQSQKALIYVKKHPGVFISLLVLCETTWVLSSCYNIKKTELCVAIENILSVDEFEVEDSDIVWRSLSEYKKLNIDFSDCLIGVIAKYNNTDIVATFDKKAAKSNLFELL